MDNAALFKKVKNIQLVSSKLVEGLFAGNYRSVFRGPGIEFDEVRRYTEEEDSRFIDWNVSSRMTHPYIKTFREERELTLFLVVDVSASLFFGGGESNKRETAALLTALLSFAAVSNNDKVGAVLFSDRIERWVPPRKGKKHALRLIRDTLGIVPEGKGSELATALRTVYESLPRRGICFVVSDFKTESGYKELTLLARKHDVIAVNITDPLDFSFPKTGVVDLRDSESGIIAPVLGKMARFQREYHDFWYQHYSQWLAACKRRKIDTITVNTEDDLVATLLAFFRRRKQ